VVVLKGDGALWWAGAVNKGVRYALRSAKDSDMIMTINNDVFFENDFLSKMVASAKASPGTLLNPISVDSRTKRVISGGNRMISWMLAISHHPYYGRPLDKIDASKMIFVHMLSGRGTLIPVTVFRKIGLYDNRLFPQYGADNEFTCRAFRRGFKLAILPGVVLYVNKATTGLDPLYTNINLFEIFEAFFSIKSTNNLKMRWRFARKCAPPYTAFSYFFISFLKILVQSTIVNYVKRVFV
jgi:GT2 family glycosyltransferase